MDRLTKRNENGSAYYPECYEDPCYGCGCIDDDCELEIRACNKLADYEDLGLTPKQLKEISKMYADKCKALGEYQKAEKQGLLLRVPVSKGQMVYEPSYCEMTKCGGVREYKVTGISDSQFWADYDIYDHEDIGNTIFLTWEEAAEKLNEMKKEKTYIIAAPDAYYNGASKKYHDVFYIVPDRDSAKKYKSKEVAEGTKEILHKAGYKEFEVIELSEVKGEAEDIDPLGYTE